MNSKNFVNLYGYVSSCPFNDDENTFIFLKTFPEGMGRKICKLSEHQDSVEECTIPVKSYDKNIRLQISDLNPFDIVSIIGNVKTEEVPIHDELICDVCKNDIAKLTSLTETYVFPEKIIISERKFGDLAAYANDVLKYRHDGWENEYTLLIDQIEKETRKFVLGHQKNDYPGEYTAYDGYDQIPNERKPNFVSVSGTLQNISGMWKNGRAASCCMIVDGEEDTYPMIRAYGPISEAIVLKEDNTRETISGYLRPRLVYRRFECPRCGNKVTKECDVLEIVPTAISPSGLISE